MSLSSPVSAERPPEWLFVRLDPDPAPERRRRLLWLVESILPLLNWRSHVVIIHGDRKEDEDATVAMVEVAALHLERVRFTSVSVHPLIHLHDDDPPDGERFHDLLAAANRFQLSAYRDQGESRLAIFPILVPGPEVTVARTEETARFFNSELATPAVYLEGGLPGEPGWDDLGSVARLCLGSDDHGTGEPGLMRVMWSGHVLESVLEKVHRGNGGLLGRCTSHVVLDEFLGGLFPCFEQWDRLLPVSTMDDDPSTALPIGKAVPEERCSGCIFRIVPAMAGELVANDRAEEGRRTCSSLGMAYSERQEYLRAAEIARCSHDLSSTDSDRAMALLHLAMCHLALGELEESEAALLAAAPMADDPGLIAYHRGRVQFAWRDWIEALERFGEALDSPSPEVPSEDLHFHMALSHVNLEEYAEARLHLELSGGAGREAPVRFYQGVCDFNDGDMEVALSRFRESLSMGPADEDLGRVRFYIAACLKELERYDEAMEHLRRAVADDPGDLANHNLLGYCLYRTGRYEEAVTAFRRALEIDPRSGIDWANLGSNLQQLGRIDEAVSAYRKALVLDPGITFARERLARLES